MDPLAGSPWSRPETVAGFVTSPPNADLIAFAEGELRRAGGGVAIDLGCGAGRNAIPLAHQGWRVVGTDLSLAMLVAAAGRAGHELLTSRFQPLLAPMHHLPIGGATADLVIAHGIWNLARNGAEFRAAVREAARVARPGAGLFVFTFSRHTLPPDASPVAGETFVFTQFSGDPQCFLSEEQLTLELRAAGFEADAAVPIQELNRRPPGMLAVAGPPVIYQGVFRRVGS